MPRGLTAIGDKRYILQPEVIESVFILYHLTGREELVESAWTMWEAIQKHTTTPIGNAALSDITLVKPTPSDSMESFGWEKPGSISISFSGIQT
jgi:mannosyl-oligosaccharide alpha-1,2-mannosidase